VPTDLAGIQRWMIDALRGAAPDPVGVILPSPTLSAGARLDLYRRSYLNRLVESLREMHPALRHLLGDEVFDAFALDYLQTRPPSSYTLFELDAGLAGHLAATRPDDEAWPDLIIDVVRFERAFLEVYDGPGLEGRALPQAADVLAVPSGASITVTPVPCARLLRSRYPVGDYVLAVRRGEAPAIPGPSPEPACVALVRRDYAVKVVPVAGAAYGVLAALVAGTGSAAAAAAAGTGHATVRQWIAAWADHGLFATLSVKGPPCCERPASDP
jgi:hypothetical protein